MDLGIDGLGDATWVGSGASAIVYRATQERLQRDVAIKVLTERDPSFVRRFEREARMLGRLSQKSGIVTVYDTGVTTSGEPYLILELCPSSLQDRLHTDGTIDPREACRIMAHIAKAVASAHELGVVHRDLKPANILISPDGEPLVTDFGIGAVIGDSTGMQTTTSVGFTPGYVAPETLGGKRPEEPADVYALGATLYHLVRGNAPFVDTLEDSSNLLALASRVVNEPVPDLRTQGVPAPVCEIIEAAMAKEPDGRPTAAVLATALQAASQGRQPEGLGAGRSGPSGPPASVTVAGVPTSAPLPDPGPGAPVPMPPASNQPASAPSQAPISRPLPPPPAAPRHAAAHPGSGPPPGAPPPSYAPSPVAASAESANRAHRPASAAGASSTNRTAMWVMGGGLLAVFLLTLLVIVGSSDTEPDPVTIADEATETTAAPAPATAGDAESDFVSDDGGGGAGTLTDDGAGANLEPASEAAPTCQGRSDGVLRIGGLLPQTGDLAFLSGPMEAGVELAVAEINAAGGVNGQPIEFIPGDSGADAAIAGQTTESLLRREVDVVIGGATSATSLAVIDQITGACVVQFSPSNTTTALTNNDPQQMYFRTAPSDALQGQALADLIVEEGGTDVLILALDNDYAEQLTFATEKALDRHGVDVDFEIYDDDAGSTGFELEVAEVLDAQPDALMVAGFGETPELLAALFAAGLDPGTTGIYLVDGNLFDYGTSFPGPGNVAGVKGTNPVAPVSPEFEQMMSQADPSLVDNFGYGPESYDAVIVAALAAEAAGTDTPSDISRRINGVTGAGVRCTSFAECRDLLAAGEDIDYDGQSGPLNFGRAGEPRQATFGVLTFGADNTIDQSATVYRIATLQS